MKKKQSNLSKENKELKTRLAEAEELLAAIRSGSVDAFVTDDQKVFSLKGTDYVYKAFVETINEGALTLAHDGTIMYCNKRLAEVFGFPIQKIVGVSILDFAVPDEIKKLESILAQSKNQTIRAEVKFKRNSNPAIPTLVSCNPLEMGINGLCMVITDLTEQKNVEAELKKHRDHLEEMVMERTNTLTESEAKYKSMANNVDSVLMRYDKNLRIVYLNPRAEESTGIPNDKLIGKTNREIGMPEHLCILWEKSISDVFLTGQPRNVEFDFPLQKVVKSFYLKLSPELKADGTFTHVLGISTDITERKKLEMLLRAKAKEQEAILDSTPAMIFYRDKENRFLRVNKTFANIMEIPKNRIEGESIFDLFPKEHAQGYWDDDLEVIKSGRAKHNIIEPMESPRGSRIVQTSKIPYKDAQGNVIGIIGFSLDITERKRVEVALRESEEKYKALVETPNSIIMTTDKDLNITFMNDFGLKFFGYTWAELKGQNILGTTVVRTDSEGINLAAMTKDMVGHPEKYNTYAHENRRKGGELVWVSWANKIKYDNEGNVLEILAVGNDISKIKEAEDILRRDNETFEKMVKEQAMDLIETKIALERANRLSDIGVLAATVAHELRNPLAAIQMATYNIKRKAQNPALDKHLANIDKKVGESDQIINNLLFYSRLKTPQYKNINICDMIEECADGLIRSEKKEVAVIKELDAIKDIMIEADPTQIKELFNNLLNNAYDAAPSQKGEINIVAENGGEFINVRIEDNGPGIAGDIIDKIFDPFFTTKAKGTGLGLSVCNQIVSMHNGKIGINRGFTKGTSIFVHLNKERISGL